VAAGLAVRWSSRVSGRGSGSAAPGAVALKLAPGLLAALSRGRRVVVVSATNGKSTTTRMIAAAMQTQQPVLTNAEGSNLERGLVSTLLTDWRQSRDLCLFEVDELALTPVAAATEPELYVLGNLSRDQLDRMTEVRALGRRWAALLAAAAARAAEAPDGKPSVVANCDDPHVVAAVLAEDSDEPILPTVWVAAGHHWTSDAASCPRCAAPWKYDVMYACGSCGLRRPTPDWSIDGSVLRAPDGRDAALNLALPGRANRANAALAIAAAATLGVDLTRSITAVQQVSSVAGRYARVAFAGAEVRLLLAKNPAGWLEMLATDPDEDLAGAPVVLVLNAQGPDGRDTSWIWDVPFEQLRGRALRISGERAEDLAVRCRYADLDVTLCRDPLRAVEELVAATGAQRVDLLANYTAFESVRQRLGVE
jgi:UDP-N-acetylmuramyl tripeptide synthase